MLFNFLHTFLPEPILISFGQINIYWYGFFIVCAVLTSLSLTIWLAKKMGLNQELIIDLSFWLIIGAVIGARIYHILLELPYYMNNPLETFKLWHGGLAIHGAIFTGIFVVYFFTRLRKVNFWHLSASIVPGLALGQAIGRWGNYFNQEIYGLPTNLPWGIPINYTNRPLEFFSQTHFHPTFLYESIGSLIIFAILLSLCFYIIKNHKTEIFKVPSYELCVICYAILYSLLRFSLEFIRLDPTPIFWGLKLPQWVSLTIIVASAVWLLLKLKKRDKNNIVLEQN